MEYPVFRIKTDGIHAKLYVDDTEIKGVCRYSITHEAGKLPQIHLDITAQWLDFDSDMYPPLPEPWASYYTKATGNAAGTPSSANSAVCQGIIEGVQDYSTIQDLLPPVDTRRVKPGSFVSSY